MADYLRQGVDVYFYRHDEVPDVPPVAIAVVQDPAYWIDCAESEDVAVLLATQLDCLSPAGSYNRAQGNGFTSFTVKSESSPLQPRWLPKRAMRAVSRSAPFWSS